LLGASDDTTRTQVQELDALLADYANLPMGERARSVGDARSIVAGLMQRSPNGRTPVAPPQRQVATPRPARQAPAQASTVSPAATPRPVAATTPTRPAPAKLPTGRISSLSDTVRLLPGVGEARAKLLEQLGVRTVRDLLRLYPRRHIDYSNVQKIGSLLFGHISTIQGTVQSIESSRTRTGKQLFDVVVDDGTGRIHAAFFNPWIERQLRPGVPVSLSGRIEQMRGNLCLSNPEWEVLDHETINTGRMIPVYPLTKGLYQKTLRALVRYALDGAGHLLEDYIPDDLRRQEGVIGLVEATEWIHFPDGETPVEAQRRLDAARGRLAFDEFLVLQLGLLQRKQDWQSQPGTRIEIDREALDRFGASLPFAMTGAQQRALREILGDMAAPRPMTRLLQGDVGSGKTIVAALAALAAVRAGYQVALMAPTELLAEQHSRGLRTVFDSGPEDLRPRLAMLTGSVGGTEREMIYEATADGRLDLIVGTQALIQSGLEFRRLGLAIIDEQHRFGVEQRASLRGKGESPDLLVMTATPIPRTLALTLHGDLDVSTLDELPPGRQPIETYWASEAKRAGAYSFVREQVAQGRQAFIVFPLVEESEAIDARAAVAEHERLAAEVFPDLRLGLLHGRMKPAEKDAVMLAFRDREIDILVSTSVVEVGIDVPNATVMLIDGAERFGLSQLHQFRGRVGRGPEKSYCILLSTDPSIESKQRLQAMVDSQDGFRLAQIDLDLRGPGDFLGKRQSGLPEMELASFADVRDLERARMAAERVLAEDPKLDSAKYALLKARVDAFWQTAIADVS
ncbi:MAG TPA: ATP-dependent DNA helicase RecG, partial [Thermomicrobiales bacterium]|nr:ATP-dependent DNA helicase RecG [Thermomicrobiales bacterium]